MASFLFYFAGLGTILAATLVLPILIGLSVGEYEAAINLFVYALLFGFLTCCTLMGTRGWVQALGRIQGLYLMVLSWLMFPALLAIVFADILNISYVDALFETVSGFTTTGASGLATLEDIPKCMIVLRSQMQWLGGLATLVSFTLVLAPNGIGGLPQGTTYRLVTSVLSSPDRLMRYCIVVTEIYMLITLACYCGLMLAGTSAFNGLILTMTAVSTGGFLPTDLPLDETISKSAMLVMAFFLLVGSTSIFWHRMIVTWRRDDFMRHRESYFIIIAFFFLSFYIAKVLVDASALTGVQQFDALIEGMFDASSIISTSGIESRPGVFSILSPIVVLTFLLIGGGCFSTAGGIKFFRIGTMSAIAHQEINGLIYPHAVHGRRVGSINYNIEQMKSLWSFFIFTIFAILAGGLALSFSDFDFQAAFTASVAAFSNAGPAYSPLWNPTNSGEWPAYFEMDGFHKMVLAALMLLGRLEILAVVSVFNVFYWVER